jgi:cytochrome c biogenesis protein CcmG, thiol:disulfide interchange protein DsbE
VKVDALRPAIGFVIALAVLGIIAFGVRKSAAPPAMRPEDGRKTPLRLTLPRLDGGDWSLAQQRGKVVLVNFWATWCPPCREETPWLVKLSQRFREQGLEVVGVAMDDDGEEPAIRRFLAQYRVPYPILRAGENSPLAQSIENLPTTLLIDRRGRVARTYVGLLPEEDVENDVTALLAETK